jgi:putative endonuclease
LTSKKIKLTKAYATYILECADGTLYVGSTTDVARRVEEHNFSDKGAKYTKSRRPVVLKHTEFFENRSLAQKREHELKKLTRSKKLEFLEKGL